MSFDHEAVLANVAVISAKIFMKHVLFIVFDNVFLGVYSGPDISLIERAQEAESSQVYCC